MDEEWYREFEKWKVKEAARKIENEKRMVKWFFIGVCVLGVASAFFGWGD